MHLLARVMGFPALALLQGGGWVGPAAGISLVVIALALAVIAVILVLMAREAVGRSQALADELGQIRRDLEPTLQSVREVAEAGRGLASRLEAETTEIIRTSQRIRHDVGRGFRRARRRLADLDALAEVVQGELEETALDVAATLRTARRGKGVIGRIRRLIRGRR